ncbi:tetratricopeptide repeat protein [Nannocystis punicea]|uniref:Tetratricopeptide repeat protein n=1 Tax=Nannocystis punicea TaxID=2995304 RepID=A0ABY7GUI2_9BACT|nr:tetratricopeptide repeat protein [Nannocystis poenicansa]WAS90613.1 tetratricopeptide repeat protein [Nannocystis poenicansa]
MDDEVVRLRALRDAHRHAEHLAAACALVARRPGDVEVQIEAAYGLDRAGEEARAIVHYEAARRLGVPAQERRPFTVGLGSTLRNVGRHDEAVAVFARALAEDPGYAPFAAFLALALASAGRSREALATMLQCALEAARPGAFDGYERALAGYRRDLARGDEDPASG